MVGSILAVAYFSPVLVSLGDIATVHFDILAAIAFILGGGNLLRNHGEKVFKQHAGWGYSLIAVVCFLLTLTFGLGKFGVVQPPGMWTAGLIESGETVALAQVEADFDKPEPRFGLSIAVRKASAGQVLPVTIDGRQVAQVEIDPDGKGKFRIPPNGEGADALQPALAKAYKADGGSAITIGTALAGRLVRYSWITGEYNSNGSLFWWMFEYWFKPLQQTTFAMLAFYVASAAFRAFRAKNVESVLLLGTAFVILLGRTYFGAVLTGWLPDEGFWSCFQIPNLTVWVMSVWNTAGSRAIIIGIALGVASMSLKVILGIDRSYLGSAE
jgi:hypothetical protein